MTTNRTLAIHLWSTDNPELLASLPPWWRHALTDPLAFVRTVNQFDEPTPRPMGEVSKVIERLHSNAEMTDADADTLWDVREWLFSHCEKLDREAAERAT